MYFCELPNKKICKSVVPSYESLQNGRQIKICLIYTFNRQQKLG